MSICERCKKEFEADPMGTGAQRRLYWHYLRQIGVEIGEEPETLHDTFKAMFLVDREGKIPVVKSTRSLSVKEFQEYIEKIRRRVAVVGIELVEPLVEVPK